MVHSDDMGRRRENDQETAMRNEATTHLSPLQGPRRLREKPGSSRENPDKQANGTLQGPCGSMGTDNF